MSFIKIGKQRRTNDALGAFTITTGFDRDKTSFDIFWLKDESLEDSANLPAPDIIAAEIMEDLQAALEQFSGIAADLGSDVKPATSD